MATLVASTLDAVLSEIETRLSALTWGTAVPPATPPKMFAEVRRWTSEDLVEAFQALIAVQDRVCFTVLTGVDWTPEEPERYPFYYRRQARVTLLVSDRQAGDPRKALWGDGSTMPGVWELAARAEAAVCGLLIQNPSGVIVSPDSDNPMEIVDLKRLLPGRVVVAVSLVAQGGRLTENMGNIGPVA